MRVLTGAVVLAAGASSRMESPKALLPFRGTTFIGQLLEQVGEAAIDNLVVAVSQYDDKILRHIDLRSVTVVYNSNDHNNGAIGSIRAAIPILINLKVDRALICPVDHPGISSKTMCKLLEAGDGREIVVPTFHGRRGHPVIFPRSMFPLLLSELADSGAREILRSQSADVLEVAVDDPWVAKNINTKDDYLIALQADR